MLGNTVDAPKALTMGSLNEQLDRYSELFRARGNGYSAIMGVKRVSRHMSRSVTL